MNGSTKTFSDVADGKWYSSYIRQAVQYGLISGYADGTFSTGAVHHPRRNGNDDQSYARQKLRNGSRAAQHGLSVPRRQPESLGVWQHHGSSNYAQTLTRNLETEELLNRWR